MNLKQRGVAVLAISLGIAVLHGTEGTADDQSHTLPPGALKRLGTIRWRTGSRILCAAYSPDGKILVTGCGDDPVRLWDAKTGLVLRQIKEPWVYALAFSPDGSVLATASAFKTARLWNPLTGEPITPPLKGHEGVIKALAFSRDGTLLATAGADRTARLWSVPGGQPVGTLSGHLDEVNALAFAPDGKLLASAGGDRTIRLWQVPGGQLLRRLDGGCAVAALAITPDGKSLISGGDDNLIRLWELGAPQEARQLRGHESSITSLTVARDGKTLISGDLGHGIRIWDIARGVETGQIRRGPGDADALALAPDGGAIAGGGSNNTVKQWQINGEKAQGGNQPESGVTSLALARDGKHLASGYANGSAHFWKADSGKPTRVQPPGAPGDALVAYAPDGQKVALADGATFIRLLDAHSGKEIQQLAAPSPQMLCLAFSPDGKRLAVGTRDRGLVMCNLAGNDPPKAWSNSGSIQALAFTPDSKRLAGGSADKITIWDIASHQQVLQINTPSPVAGLAFSSDGDFLAAGLYDSQILLRDMRPGADDGLRQRMLHGHNSAVFAVVFGPDGRTLASGSHDHTVRLWETASGQMIQAWPGHLGAVTCLAFLPGGRSVVSGSADTSLLFWDITGQSPGGKLASAKVGAGDMEGLWQDLASTDVPRAFRALWTLVAGADEVVPLLESQKRVFLVDPEHVQQLLRDLNHNKFAVRERAYGELAKYGRWIEGVLDVARRDPPSEEVRRRVEKLLARFQVPGALTLAQERLRARRLMMMLEQSATPAARELLEKLSHQAAEADLRAEASASLARLAKRSAS
jgi:WD40 repeat protein